MHQNKLNLFKGYNLKSKIIEVLEENRGKNI